MLLFKHACDFFWRFDRSRNRKTRKVVHVEVDSVVLLSGRLEASGVKSVWGEVSQESPKNR